MDLSFASCIIFNGKKVNKKIEKKQGDWVLCHSSIIEDHVSTSTFWTCMAVIRTDINFVSIDVVFNPLI